MTLGEAIERLRQEYDTASRASFVTDKVTWALHQTWRAADHEGGNYTGRR